MQQFRMFILLACLFQPILGFAYNDELECPKPPPTWWLNLGAGWSYLYDESDQGGTAHISMNGRLSKHWALTLYKNNTAIGSYNDNYINDGGLMLGYLHRKPCGYWSISSGAAFVRRTKPSYQYGIYSLNSNWTLPYKATEYRTRWGLPLQIQAFWTPFKHVGFGVIAHGIVVPDPYASVLVGIQYYT